MKQTGLGFILHQTQRPEHGIELAKAAIESGNTPVIAVGGDETLTEIVNGVLQPTPAGEHPAGSVGLIPQGTANDLADVPGNPRSLNDAIQGIAAG